MGEIKIVIPSHKRWARVLTTSVVDNAILCVADSQRDLYAKCNKGIEIVTHPDHVIGLARKRDWIAKHFGDVFMLDDDISGFKRVYSEPGERADIDSDVAYEIIQQAGDACRQAGFYLFSFAHAPLPLAYDPLKPVQLSGYHTGCAHGILKGSKLWYNPEVMNEDFWISCLNAYEHRGSWKDTRFYFAQKDTFVNPGGQSEFRNLSVEEEDFEKLQRIFGREIITLKKNGAQSKLKHAFQKTLKLPF